MSESTRTPNITVAQMSMRRPVFWGSIITLIFYLLINKGFVQNPLVHRYFASHPVEYITTLMFFVGVVVLWIKHKQIRRQPEIAAAKILGPCPDEGQSVREAGELLERLDKQPAPVRGSTLGRRIRAALQFVNRTEQVDGLEDQLRNLAETDESHSHNSYALVRIIISTIPILGFLGTVIGITRAVAELAQLVGDISFEDAINSVVSGLSVAFDTTALALALSILLMFAMFFIQRAETRFLAGVEEDVASSLVDRFQIAAADFDPTLAAVREIAEEVARSTDGLVHRQAEIWHDSVQAAQQRWNTLAVSAEKQMETSLTRALQNTLQSHAQQVQVAEEAAEERVGRYWQEMLGMLDRSTETLGAQYDELRKQGEIMQKAIDTTERVIKLEDALNNNLSSLREAHHFDETINSLAAAINLLNARLSQVSDETSRIQLRPGDGKVGYAA